MREQFVRCRDCTCPGTPHAEEGDGVYLPQHLSLAVGMTAEQQLLEVMDRFPLADSASPRMQEEVARQRTMAVRPQWYETFARGCVVGWNLWDADGPIAFDVEAMMADYTIARMAADAASDKFGDQVLAPFLTPLPSHSGNGRTASGGTSRRSGRTRSRSASSSPIASEDGQPSGDPAP